MQKKYVLFCCAITLFITACVCTGLNLPLNNTPASPSPTAAIYEEQEITLPFFDDFSITRYDWPLGFTPGDYADTTYEVVEGLYRWTVTAHQNAYSIAWAGIPAVTDFTASVEAQQVGDNFAGGDYGLIFRTLDGQRYYSFALSNDLFSVYLYDKTTGWEETVAWTSSSAILPGQVNRLKLVGANGSLAFYANEVLLTEFANDSIPQGHPGLGTDVYDAGDSIVFEFDNFSVTSP